MLNNAIKNVKRSKTSKIKRNQTRGPDRRLQLQHPGITITLMMMKMRRRRKEKVRVSRHQLKKRYLNRIKK